jgi:NAD-dependent dihydropyrimidine dehydrogenase PreA subunit
MVEVEVKSDCCNSCGECVDTCPIEIFSLEGDTLTLNHPEECISCEACVDVCPNNCISIK